jgi:hypothetical protein
MMRKHRQPQQRPQLEQPRAAFVLPFGGLALERRPGGRLSDIRRDMALGMGRQDGIQESRQRAAEND